MTKRLDLWQLLGAGCTSLASGLAFVVLACSSPAWASVITVDFESTTGYDLFFGAALTTAQAHSATHSAELPDTVNDSLVRIRPVEDYGLNLKLGTTSGSFWAFLPANNSQANLSPYMIFGADVDGDNSWDGGVNDALVIAFITGSSPYPTDTWFLTGLDANTKVHVVGNRPGLAAGTFSSSGTQDTLGALSAMSTGSGNWGDLTLRRIYVEVGEWGTVQTYTSFVDDINIAVVPEPATLALLGLGLAGLGFSRRKQ